jgi:hypothetical protein
MAAKAPGHRPDPVSPDRRWIVKALRILLVLALVGVLGSSASGQWPLENHYKVYTLTPPYTFAAPMVLHDQFGTYTAQQVLLDKFATPVEKNGEPMVDPVAHQTWWRLDIPAPGWNIGVENQFGFQSWHVGDVRFLVLPARKFEPGPPLLRNHYLAYTASGPAVSVPVHLTDQFGSIDAIAAEPALFLNPVEKIVNGAIYPIEDPEAHLACYRLNPIRTYNIPVVAYDQFGIWQFTLGEDRWLCVPSYKRQVVETETTTWGTIKSLYHQ